MLSSFFSSSSFKGCGFQSLTPTFPTAALWDTKDHALVDFGLFSNVPILKASFIEDGNAREGSLNPERAPTSPSLFNIKRKVVTRTFPLS